MDTPEEPQKKVFKARKTMKASDRQQLEAVHKAKDELLKPTEVKLLNGNHENGDMDINSETDFVADSKELNGKLDVSESHEVPVVKLSDIKDGFRNLDQTKDLKVKLDLQPVECRVNQDSKISVSVCEDKVPSENIEEENNEKNIEVAEEHADLQTSDNKASDTTFSEQPPKVNISGEGEGHIVLDGIHELEDDIFEEDVNERELEENMDTVPEGGVDINQKELQTNDLKDSTDEQEVESSIIDNKEEVLSKETHKVVDTEDAHQIVETVEEECENEATVQQSISDVSNKTHEEDQSQSMPVIEDRYTEENLDNVDMHSAELQTEEEAISSSMEIDQILKAEENKCSVGTESAVEQLVSEIQVESKSEGPDTMETDEIIPILEKLAPVEDEPHDFVKNDSSVANTKSPNEEKTEDVEEPSNEDNRESLPSEAFLVLSDEDDLCKEGNLLAVENTSDLQEAGTADAEQKEGQIEETIKELQTERSEISRRKRSKSEDLDNETSKRRRYEGEEYEAELQVKITAPDDLNKRLQNVIEKMLEEKMTVLQFTVFDKGLADLKNRVEKLECKKHENILYTIQAKIARLTKRFSAAKEDLRKKPEQTPTVQSQSPGKAVNETSTSSNAVSYRSGSTVRQMLESKRNVGDTTTASFQSTAQPLTQTASSTTPRTTNTTAQVSASPSSSSASLQGRAPPDWKLIQQRINASSIASPQSSVNSQSKPSPPVTSASMMTSVIPTSTTAAVVGTSQVSTSSTQPMSVSLQSLPVILHVPVAMQSQSQIMQGTTGTLVTNQQSGNVEFIPVQNQSAINNLPKTAPVSLSANKPINTPSMSSPGIQRNSSASSVTSNLPVQTVSTTHSSAQPTRPSLSTGSSGMYSQTSNRTAPQLKSPLSGFNSSTSADLSASTRTEPQANRISAVETVSNKRTAESTTGAKPGGVIDLTLDEEDVEITSADSRRTSTSGLTSNVQPPVTSRPLQPPQSNSLQSPSSSANLPSQATIHVLPTAQTTVNITQRPGTQTSARVSAPRTPNNPQMVYTTSSIPTAPVQTPVRNTVMQNQNLRQISPQTGGVPVRMPQTNAYVVNNGMSVGSSGPQLTVHHRPPQETARPIHPAPLPEAPQPPRLPPEAAGTSAPQKPHLKLARVQSQNGIVLSWSVLEVDRSCAIVDSYHLYAYHEDPNATSPSQWKKIGEVKALPLPMACTLTQFVSGSKYYFAVRAKDIYSRFGPFCDPQSTDVISTQSS
ncbi:hypothetical protein GDO86_007524 [Hymenochirus boettgeri]|uniref:Fibronectin type-III domain-containing protein n=1 Tax=Hymenochirus boettgeri TaxID=247094 RepID=A0A8T2IWX6_9PIPI|nr:hypothetical protein GDO86_007524 [Hymenochirus boettgeri]KAG8436463.1 hypothetical protein GDO86_007524 [Hymenochirus boettgeri]KAG8436464.1 hypothetical protein GDO86_007524 [Hymenochirus boettgeri]